MAIGSRLGSGRSEDSVPVSEVAWTECGTVGYEASLCLKEKPKHTATLRMLKKKKNPNNTGLCLMTEIHTILLLIKVLRRISPHREYIRFSRPCVCVWSVKRFYYNKSIYNSQGFILWPHYRINPIWTHTMVDTVHSLFCTTQLGVGVPEEYIFKHTSLCAL